jgi:predicted short-subunit dehydrogenase-like oxidoreductase (DUF2520 family)
MAKKKKQIDAKTKIVVIGSGNLAWHIVSHLSFFKRFDILVYGRHLSENLKQLQKEFKISITSHWSQIPGTADVYFICTGDKAISEVADKLKKLKPEGLVLHTSGTSSLVSVSKVSKNTGVFYPLQTFSFGKSVNWTEVPIFIEAANIKSLVMLEKLGHVFSPTVVKLNSEQRLKLHLAAVIAGNFSNAMYASSYAFLAEELDKSFFNHLTPLILQTAKKVKANEPSSVQTGPAVRKDKSTQKKHLSLLKDHSELKKIYKTLSKLIVRQQKANAKL